MSARTLFISILLLASCVAKADSFLFEIDGPTFSATGIFNTDPLQRFANCSTPLGCYAITGISGQLNGQEITQILPMGAYWGLMTYELELQTISPIGFATQNGIFGISGQPGTEVTMFKAATYDGRIWPTYTIAYSEAAGMSIAPVPEPSSYLLLLLAIGGLGFRFAWRKAMIRPSHGDH